MTIGLGCVVAGLVLFVWSWSRARRPLVWSAPKATVLIHRESGQPLVDFYADEVLRFPDAEAAIAWCRKHDCVESYAPAETWEVA